MPFLSFVTLKLISRPVLTPASFMYAVQFQLVLVCR